MPIFFIYGEEPSLRVTQHKLLALLKTWDVFNNHRSIVVPHTSFLLRFSGSFSLYFHGKNHMPRIETVDYPGFSVSLTLILGCILTLGSARENIGEVGGFFSSACLPFLSSLFPSGHVVPQTCTMNRFSFYD